MAWDSWLSCKKFAERVSRDIDGNLRLRDYPSYFFRIVACRTSRKFCRQMKLMEEISKNYGKQTSIGAFLDGDPDSSATLPSETVKRIITELKNADNNPENSPE